MFEGCVCIISFQICQIYFSKKKTKNKTKKGQKTKHEGSLLSKKTRSDLFKTQATAQRNALQKIFEKNRCMKKKLTKTLRSLLMTSKVEIASTIVGYKQLNIRIVLIKPNSGINSIQNKLMQNKTKIKKVILFLFLLFVILLCVSVDCMKHNKKNKLLIFVFFLGNIFCFVQCVPKKTWYVDKKNMYAQFECIKK